jgi:hypothetical protein
MAAAEERRRADMGYNGPSDYSTQVRLRVSARGALQRVCKLTPRTPQTRAPDTLLLAGEVLVLDVVLLPEPTVHASYAGSAAEGRHS